MSKRIFASFASTILLASTVFSSTALAETTRNVSEPQKQEDITIGKDYKQPNVEGKWLFNNEKDTFSWSLKWEDITYSKAYKIYRKAEGEEKYTLIKELDKKSTSYTDTSFEFGKKYTYKVNYVHGNRELDLSNELGVDYELDSDNDRLFDLLEIKQGTNPYNADTDGDKLNDGYEAIATKTNNLKADTDDNGVPDGEEDADKDGLNNLTEFVTQTNPNNEDTDADNVSDKDEVDKGTNPVKSDTDGDGLEDGYEPSVNLNPLKEDTDNDGTLDGEEQVEVTTTVEENDALVQPSVIIQSKASEGASTEITNIEGQYASLGVNLPGYISAPYEFETDVEFEEATMSFKYDHSLVTENFRPAIYYFNEETQRLEKVENQTIDTTNGKVTATVSHFSVYLLLNEIPFEEAWNKEMYSSVIGEVEGNTGFIDVVFSIDSSGSMMWNDSDNLRKEAAKSFVDKLRMLDQAAVVDFDNYARTLVSLTTDHDEVKLQIDTIDDNGGTNLFLGINQAVNEVKKGPSDHRRIIIFLTDGDGYWHESALENALENNVSIYTIGLGSYLNDSLLKRIATETGGKYYHASNANELKEIHDEVAEETVATEDVDTDKDGLSDNLETLGFRTEVGEWIQTNPYEDDTDGDGLSDSFEVGQLIPGSSPYYLIKSNPRKKDTDDDGIHDNTPSDKCTEISFVTTCHDSSPKVYNFNNFISTIMTEMSYIDMEEETENGNKPFLAKRVYKSSGSVIESDLSVGVQNKIIESFNHNQVDRDDTDDLDHWDAAKLYLNGWKLIKAEDGAGFDTGLGAVAFKKGKDIVISYRGTESNIGGIIKDGIYADLETLFLNNNIQVPIARAFAYDVIMDNPKANIYVTGHSLGGFLAQIVSYEIIEEKIDNSAFWWFNENKLQKILDNNPDMFKRGMTYNAAPFSINAMFYSILTNAIPPLTVVSKDYDDLIFNYSIKNDILSEAVWLGAAARIGRDIPVLDYDGDLSDFIDAHKLSNFYNHFK